jgi:hypothetical protein
MDGVDCADYGLELYRNFSGKVSKRSEMLLMKVNGESSVKEKQ